MTDTGSGARPGLRERTKARTRDRIREHPLRRFATKARLVLRCDRPGVVGVMLGPWTADRDLDRPAALSILEVGVRGLEDGSIP